MIGAIRSVPPAWRQAKILYWQRQCMNYSAPPDQVVFDESPTATALIDSDLQYARLKLLRDTYAPEPRKTVAAAFAPVCLKRFTSVIPSIYTPQLLPIPDGAVLFLHERTTTSGRKALVTITYCPQDMGHTFQQRFTNLYCSSLGAFAFRTSPAVNRPGLGEDIVPPEYVPSPNLRIFAGQVDPADESHFTIRYEMWGQSDVMDGWLVDSAYQPTYVYVTQRTPPVETPP